MVIAPRVSVVFEALLSELFAELFDGLYPRIPNHQPIGLGLGPTVVAATTDYVFGYDAAIGKSIALSAAVLCPVGGLLLWRSLSAIRDQLEEQM